jgi:hypothetical protein
MGRVRRRVSRKQPRGQDKTQALKIKLTRAARLKRHAASCPPFSNHITNATLRVVRYDIMSLSCGILNWSKALHWC